LFVITKPAGHSDSPALSSQVRALTMPEAGAAFVVVAAIVVHRHRLLHVTAREFVPVN
jgi:hypothetical protein